MQLCFLEHLLWAAKLIIKNAPFTSPHADTCQVKSTSAVSLNCRLLFWQVEVGTLTSCRYLIYNIMCHILYITYHMLYTAYIILSAII